MHCNKYILKTQGFLYKFKIEILMDMKNFNNKVQFSISDTPLPHNFIAEKIILSCLLINYEAIEITIKTVRVETFYFLNQFPRMSFPFFPNVIFI